MSSGYRGTTRQVSGGAWRGLAACDAPASPQGNTGANSGSRSGARGLQGYPSARRLLVGAVMLRGLVMCVVVTLLGACSLFTRTIEPPKATVRGVTVEAAGLAGVRGELRLDVTNPNGFGVPLAAIDWQLSIGGARAVTGSVQLSETIPAKGVAPVTTSLTIQATDAITVAGLLARGARDYQIAVNLRFSTAIGPLDVGVQHAGQLDAGAAGGLLGALAH
jgi:hypothetical protein